MRKSVVTVNLNGSNFGDTNLVVYQANGSDFSGLSYMSCTSWGNSLTFHASPGTKYYFQVGKIYNGGGNVQINVEVLPPPVNNNFANPVTLTNSYGEAVNTSAATTETDEPLDNCYISIQNTVWYAFTAPGNGAVTISAGGYNSNDTIMNAYRATGSGFAGLGFINCALYGSITMIPVEDGATYYFQAGTDYSTNNSLFVGFQFYPAPANDDFADAEKVATLPFNGGETNIQAASVETGEPTPSCADPYSGTLNKTIWYSYTPTQNGSITARSDGSNVVAVYTGDSLTSLTEVGCRQHGFPLTIHMNSGTKYYYQAGTLSSYGVGFLHFYLEVTPPPSVNFYPSPSEPSVFDTVYFYNDSWDPANAGFQSSAWDFGDGSTTSDWSPSHRYATDGDYSVTLAVITLDGRTASATQTVRVKTHDVTIAKFIVPQSAKAGQTRQIVVGLSNRRYPEEVEVQLYKSYPGYGWQWVGSLRQSVPVRSGNRTTEFSFNYTFTAEDAALGKVTFRAVATLVNARDALPADNEAIALPTKVMR